MPTAHEPADPVVDCIAEAARFVRSQPRGAERLLAAHRCRPDGTCTGCGPSRTRWPCSLVAIADRAGRSRRP